MSRIYVRNSNYPKTELIMKVNSQLLLQNNI